MTLNLRRTSLHASAIFVGCCLAAMICGCRSTVEYREQADRAAETILTATQNRALGEAEEVLIGTAAETLRRRLLLDQELPHVSPASLGIHDLPDTEYWSAGKHLSRGESNTVPWQTGKPLTITLIDALQIGARNSRDYQRAKEDLFTSALTLDLERDEFRHTFSGMLSGDVTYSGASGDSVSAGVGTADLGITRRFLNGIEVSALIATDLVKLLTQDLASSFGILADASISIPLLRGAGKRIAAESLKQSERNVLYEVYSFERFKRTFAVRIASEYLGVLQTKQQTRNAEENYKRLIAAGRRAKRLADSGRLPEFQLDQALQDELRARTGWIESRQSFAARLDAFKVSLGLPPDARMNLEEGELQQLQKIAEAFAQESEDQQPPSDVPPADAPIVLQEPAPLDTGRLAFDATTAVDLALDSRLDLRVSEGRVDDAVRQVYIAADALRAEVSLFGSASMGGRRSSAGSASSDDAQLRPDRGSYAAMLNIDLPLERTAERNAYRASVIALERTVRSLQELEDDIKLSIRNGLRDLQEAREGVLIQAKAVRLAEKRVRSTDLFLQAGRAEIRDVLESQDALLSAQNALTSATVGYRIAELELQRDMGLLKVKADGLWHEYALGE